MAEESTKQAQMSFALHTKEIRDVVAAIEFLRASIRTLDVLSPAGLEAVRDFMWEREKNRPGAVGDLLRTYVAYVSELQKEGKRRERTLAHGLGIEN